MGREVVVAVTGGDLDFGPRERIFYGESDGGAFGPPHVHGSDIVVRPTRQGYP